MAGPPSQRAHPRARLPAAFVSKRGEVGYFSLPARLVEPRTTTCRAYASKRVNTGGYKVLCRWLGTDPTDRHDAHRHRRHGRDQRAGAVRREQGDPGVAVLEDRRLRRHWRRLAVLYVSNRQTTSGLQYDPRWDAVVEGYFPSAVTKANDPDGRADQIEHALTPVASRLEELGYTARINRSPNGA